MNTIYNIKMSSAHSTKFDRMGMLQFQSIKQCHLVEPTSLLENLPKEHPPALDLEDPNPLGLCTQALGPGC